MAPSQNVPLMRENQCVTFIRNARKCHFEHMLSKFREETCDSCNSTVWLSLRSCGSLSTEDAVLCADCHAQIRAMIKNSD